MGNIAERDLLSRSQPQYKQSNYDQFTDLGDPQEVAKDFIKEYILVWYDPNVNSYENVRYINQLNVLSETKVFKDFKEAIAFIQDSTASFQVITSGTNGEALVNEISPFMNVFSIHVFCRSVDFHKQWAKNKEKVAGVDSKFEQIVVNIKQNLSTWQKRGSLLRELMPTFIPIFDFDEANQSEINSLNLFLQGVMNFQDRAKAKQDLLNLVKITCSDKDNIAKFEVNYGEYSMGSIFHWYTKESFVFKTLINCIQIHTSDSIQFCRLIFKDLEAAIKEQYHLKSKNFYGLVYKAVTLSSDRWSKLESNIGNDIEMFGFLSTTKDEKTAIRSIEQDFDKKALITIIIPNSPDKGEQGFAEVKDFSAFLDEDEVLFNIRSRFTILEAYIEEKDGKKYRRLILLHEARALRQHLSLKDIKAPVQIQSPELMKCNLCSVAIHQKKDDIFFINLRGGDRYICYNCVTMPKKIMDPLLSMTSTSKYIELSNKHKTTLMIPGILMQYHPGLNVPFYGSKCIKCQNNRLDSQYRCLAHECHKAKRIWCKGCFNYQDNECIKNDTHMVIYEDHPFTFWSEITMDKENIYNNYYDFLSKEEALLEQAGISYTANDHVQARQYYEKFLKLSGNEYSKRVALAHRTVATICEGLKEYKEAAEHYLQALDCLRHIGQEKNEDIAGLYSKLGAIHYAMEQYDKAGFYHMRALELQKELLTENHRDVANSYNNLGLALHNIGQFEAAKTCLLKGLQITEDLNLNQDPIKASLYRNLGLVYSSGNEHDEAVQYMLKAVDINKEIFGENHPSIAVSYRDLATFYEESQQYKKAEESFLKAVELFDLMPDYNTKDVSSTYNHLGVLYLNLKEYDKALEFHKKALELQKASKEEKHSAVANSYSNIGSIYLELQQHESAIEYFLKALTIVKTVYGKKHNNTIALYLTIGRAYYDLKCFDQARLYLLDGLQALQRAGRENNPNEVELYSRLVEVYDALQQPLDSIESSFKIIEICSVNLGANHPTIGLLREKVAGRLSELGMYDEARQSYLNAVEIFEAREELKSRVEMADLYYSLGEISQILGENDDVLDFHLKALKIWMEKFGETHPVVINSYKSLARAYEYVKGYEGAIKYNLKAAEAIKLSYGDKDIDLVSLYIGLASLYKEMGEADKTEEYEQLALDVQVDFE